MTFGVWPHRPTTTARLSNCFLAEIIVPPTPPRGLLVAAKLLLLPIAVLVWLADRSGNEAGNLRFSLAYAGERAH